MTQTALHPTARPRAVLVAQIRAVGLTLGGPARVVMVLVGVGTLLIAAELLAGGDAIDFHPEHQALPGLLGLVFPIGVWRGEQRFGAGFLWTLPVDRRLHALAKVFAGWVWLMGTVAFFVLWLLALALLSGGTVFAEEVLRVLPSVAIPAPGTLDPSAVRDLRWTARPLLWLAPFTGATGTYLLASALTLGPRHPLRWIVGAVLGLVLLVAAGDASESLLLIEAPLRSLMRGPFGLDALLTARTESLQVAVTFSTGETVVVWQALPDLRQWGMATLIWSGIGLVALGAAVSRHRECR